MSLLFNSDSSKGELALLLVRLGMAFSFVFDGIVKLGPTKTMMADMFSKMMMLPMGAAETLTVTIGALEILSGILLVVGLLTKLAALLQVVIIVASIFFLARLGVGDPNLPAVWKDPALLLLAIALIIRGAGKYSVDERIAQQRKK